MKKYSELVNKQFKFNKTRSAYTIIGIILGVVLFTTVGNLNHYINNKNIEQAKNYSGNYEAIFRDISQNQYNLLKSNAKILNYREVFNENFQLKKYNTSLVENENKNKDMDIGINIKENRNIRETIIEISNLIGISDSAANGILVLNDVLIDGHEKQVISKFENLNEEKIAKIFMNITILLLTSILTYGSINVSMRERIKYFSTLRCIGATGDKVRYLLIKESFILGALSIIPGLIIGNIISFSIINIVFEKLMKLDAYGIRYEIYWQVVAETILMMIFTITMSSIIPVIKAGKISPIQGVKTGGINRAGIKKRKSMLIRKIFGYKGELAYKNIRANNKSFIISITTLSLLLIILVSFTGYYIGSIQGLNEEDIKEKDINISLYNSNYFNTEDSVEYIFEKQRNILDYLDSSLGIKNVVTQIEIPMKVIVENLKSNNIITNEINFNHNESEYTYIDNSSLIIYNNEALKGILPYIEGGNIEFEDFNNNGILIVNKNKEVGLLKNQYKNISNLNKNDSVLLYLNKNRDIDTKLVEELNNLQGIKSKFIGNIDSRYIYNWRNNDTEGGVVVIASESFYENNKDIIDKNIINSSRFITEFDLIENKDSNIDDLEKYLQGLEEGSIGYNLIDNKTAAIELKNQIKGLAIIAYTILFISIGIGIINIINNKTINISLRKKEFGTMLAIGLKKEDLRKIIMLEGIVQWFVASIIGSGISYIVLKVMFIVYKYLGSIEESKVPIWIIIMGVIILLIINLVASKLSLKRYKDFSAMELIREEE